MSARCHHWSWFQESYPLGVVLIAHGVTTMAASRQMRLESFALGRSRYCLLISVVQLEANRQVDVLVDTLHCKTEQRRASVLCQLGVQLAASRPIDIVSVISLIHRSICQSCLRSQPVRLANYFANKATILANNAHTVMIQQKIRYQKR